MTPEEIFYRHTVLILFICGSLVSLALVVFYFIALNQPRRFPVPRTWYFKRQHTITYEKLARYWNKLDTRWRQECEVIVLRIRKVQPGDDRSNVWKPVLAFDTPMPTPQQIALKLSRPDEVNDPYTIRINRTWEPQPGVERKEEICVAHFEA